MSVLELLFSRSITREVALKMRCASGVRFKCQFVDNRSSNGNSGVSSAVGILAEEQNSQA